MLFIASRNRFQRFLLGGRFALLWALLWVLLSLPGSLLLLQASAAEFKVEQVQYLYPEDFRFHSFKLEIKPAAQQPVVTDIPQLDGLQADGLQANSPEVDDQASDAEADQQQVEQDNFLVRSQLQMQFCQQVDQKLGSVSLQDCLYPEFVPTGFSSMLGQSLMRVDFTELDDFKPLGRVLLIGGAHGDELAGVSIVFQWTRLLQQYHAGEFIWRVVPVMNPDGLFQPNSTRTNANGIDLNRNMPTPDWENTALQYWRQRAQQSPRKFPGDYPGSEPETQWLMYAVQNFKPDVIISLHAPHNLVDYDAPERDKGPAKLGSLKKRALGTYPGSLGNYAGEKRGIPVVTIELPSSNIAVSEHEYKTIWLDLLGWLGDQLRDEKNRFRPTTEAISQSAISPAAASISQAAASISQAGASISPAGSNSRQN